MRNPLIGPLVAIGISSVMLVPQVADTRATIHLLTGASGTPCAPDPKVTFTSTSVLTPQPAIVGTGAPADPCAVQDDLHQPGKSRCITTTNSADVSATFTITFDLPRLFGNPSLDLLVKMDDTGSLYLNNHFLDFYCGPGHPVASVHFANPAYFLVGRNTLTFGVANGPNCGVAAPRSGPDDAMNLQFEGAVTYDPQAGGGLDLGWNDCGGLPASLNETFACNTNVGIHTLFGSFVAPCCVTAMSANEVVMDIQTVGVSLAPWWGMRAGTCRASASLVGNFDFTGGPFTCYDYWQAGAIGAFSEDSPIGNRARVKGVFALPAGDSRITAIPEGTEVYSFKLNINNAKSTGLGACAGCSSGACIVLNSIKLNQPVGNPNGSKFISSPAVRNFATWQGGTGADCYAATPAKNVSWGKIKAQYR